MRWINIIIVALFALATFIFAIQNFQTVTLAFLGLRTSMPLALLVPIIYILGMVTGGSLWSLLRSSIERSRTPAV